LITGLSGYVAAHTVKILLEKLPSSYKIRGTVRSKDSIKKLQPLIDEIG
jgi:hypothetical protein